MSFRHPPLMLTIERMYFLKEKRKLQFIPWAPELVTGNVLLYYIAFNTVKLLLL